VADRPKTGYARTRQPEVRRYRARWRDDDQPVADWSDIAQVTARP